MQHIITILPYNAVIVDKQFGQDILARVKTLSECLIASPTAEHFSLLRCQSSGAETGRGGASAPAAEQPPELPPTGAGWH